MESVKEEQVGGRRQERFLWLTLMVESLCATTTVVRPTIMRLRASWTMRSDSVSFGVQGGGEGLGPGFRVEGEGDS
jgi:hypothetical protein